MPSPESNLPPQASTAPPRGLAVETATVCASTLAPLICAALLALVNPTFYSPSSSRMVITVVMIGTGSFLVFGALYQRGERWRDIGFIRNARALFWVFPILAVQLFSELVVSGALSLAGLGWQGGGRISGALHGPWRFPYAVAAPFFEELVVRAYLMTRLKQLGWASPAAVALSVGLQTAYHAYYGLSGMLILVPVFLTSAVFFAWKRNIVPVILAHVLLDLWLVARL